jgi:hypothetical protein
VLRDESLMAPRIADDVIDSAEAVLANRHDRRFTHAVRSFVDVVAQVADPSLAEWSVGSLEVVRHLSAQVVRAIEVRLEDDQDPPRARRALTSCLEHIRQVLLDVNLREHQHLRT